MKNYSLSNKPKNVIHFSKDLGEPICNKQMEYPKVSTNPDKVNCMICKYKLKIGKYNPFKKPDLKQQIKDIKEYMKWK